MRTNFLVEQRYDLRRGRESEVARPVFAARGLVVCPVNSVTYSLMQHEQEIQARGPWKAAWRGPRA